MLLTFTIDSSVDIQDSCFDERFRLRRALRASIRASGFHACFGPLLALQTRSDFDSSSGEILDVKVFDCFGLRHWTLKRATGFPARFCWCHQHWPAPRAGACTGCLQAPEPGADGQPPAAALPCQRLLSMYPVIPL